MQINRRAIGGSLRRRRLATAAMAVVLATSGGAAFVLTGIGTASAAANAPVVSAASNRCLDVTGAGTANGTAVIIWDCTGTTNQRWTTTSSSQLTVYGNKCLTGAAGGDTAGDPVQISDCTGAANQRWTFTSSGTVTNGQAGLCLDVSNAGTVNGTGVLLWTCHGGANQRWSQTGGSQPTAGPTTPGGGGGTCNVAPVDPQATAAARRLLCYVQSQYGNHIISGQQESTWIGGPDYEIDYIRNNTGGKLPAIRGLDAGDSPTFGSRAVAWWQAGGIPMVGYHMGSPSNAADGYASSRLGTNLNNALTAGTTENARLRERLDRVSAQLAQVQAAGGAVIWRPYHEAGGTWFWWSMEGGAQYNRLWRYTFDYMTRTKGLHNLVWLHGYNGSPNSSFYPGKQYVDIGGADTYAGSGNYNPLLSMYNASRNIYGGTLPIALHENGPIPDPNQLQSSGARWVLFGTWHGTHLTSENSTAHLRMVYNHSYVITRDELPNLR